jgi:hypothetical protein
LGAGKGNPFAHWSIFQNGGEVNGSHGLL